MTKNGRPRADINMEQLAALCRLKPTEADCAAFFKVSAPTIVAAIKRETGLTFLEFREQNLVHTRNQLIRTALKMAIDGKNPVMIIFCLKNLCGWQDKADVTVTVPVDDKLKDVPTTTLKAFAKQELVKLKAANDSPA